ncbi:darobactin export ABC transporter permease subunit [Yersinia mollaretii]|uniref:darobactin export ABC transporter permease subunit n=1 Tax=Yersinia mollaretii TaxID=33060 RepID=UPI00119DE073|nr:darobactin export ABC transporter permease subunit [Yersinia mollaretii]
MLISEFFNDVKLSPMASILAITITALGMVSSFLVLVLYLTDSNIEKHHSHYSQTYRLETQLTLPSGDKIKSAQVALPLLSVLKNEKNIQEIAYTFRLFTKLQVNGRVYNKVDIYAVSPNFFNIVMPYQPKIAPLARNEIIITPEFNHQYLQMDNPKGQTITLGGKHQYLIKEVVEFNNASRFNTRAVIAFSPELIDGYHDKRQDWYDMHVYAFVTMEPGTELTAEQLNALINQHVPRLPGAPFIVSPDEFIQLSARNITDIHYDNSLPDEMSTVIAKSYIYTLYAAGIFIFLTTVMNFFNVNNVINSNKKSSFQIKKSVGASHAQLLIESFIIATLQTLCILVLAITLLAILLSLSMSIKALILTQGVSYLWHALLPVVTSIYVAVIASHLTYLYVVVFPNPSSHSNYYNDQPLSRYVYQGLLCVQIIIAGVIIYLWAGIMTQNSFMQRHDFGYEKENIITFPLSDELSTIASINNVEDELKHTIGVEALSLSSWQPFNRSRHSSSVSHQNQQEKDKLVSINILNANKNFVDVWGLKTLAGNEHTIVPSDSDDLYHAIVTRSFITAMGFASYDEVLNTIFYMYSGDAQRKIRILSVVNDFYLAERNEKVTPQLIFIEDKVHPYGALKLQTSQDIAGVKRTLERYHITPEQIKSVNSLHQESLSSSRLIQTTVNNLTLLSMALILISTVIISMSETKRIEKTLKIMDAIGGSIYTHMVFFIQQNIVPVFVAVIVSLPVGLFLLNLWLNQYVIINGQSYIYAMTALLAFLITIIIVMCATLLFNTKFFKRKFSIKTR